MLYNFIKHSYYVHFIKRNWKCSFVYSQEQFNSTRIIWSLKIWLISSVKISGLSSFVCGICFIILFLLWKWKLFFSAAINFYKIYFLMKLYISARLSNLFAYTCAKYLRIFEHYQFQRLLRCSYLSVCVPVISISYSLV